MCKPVLTNWNFVDGYSSPDEGNWRPRLLQQIFGLWFMIKFAKILLKIAHTFRDFKMSTHTPENSHLVKMNLDCKASCLASLDLVALVT